MRSKVEYRRCGCGQLIGLRESCPRCAAAARVRLHATGVCDAERPRQPYDNGQHQGNAALYKEPPLGKRPHWLDIELPDGALRVDWQTREEWERRYAAPTRSDAEDAMRYLGWYRALDAHR